MKTNNVVKYERLTNDFNIGEEHYALGKITTEDGAIHYVAINYEYCDDNGMLKQALNGLQMHTSDTLQECIESVKMCYRIKHGESDRVLAELTANL